MAKTQKTLAQQPTCAQERARKAHLTIVSIGFDDRGFSAKVTSERDPNIEYRITRDQATGCLVCPCPASVVCKHIGTVLNEGASYHSNSKRPEDMPVTPNPNRPDDPEPEPPAPSSVPALGILAEQQREDAERAARFAPKSLCCFCHEQPGTLQKRAGLFCSEACFGWYVQAKHELLLHPAYAADEVAEWEAFGAWLEAETAKLERAAMTKATRRATALLVDAGAFSIFKGAAR